MGAGADLLAAHARHSRLDWKPHRHQPARPPRFKTDLETGRPTQLYLSPAKKTRTARVVQYQLTTGNWFDPNEHQSALRWLSRAQYTMVIGDPYQTRLGSHHDCCERHPNVGSYPSHTSHTDEKRTREAR